MAFIREYAMGDPGRHHRGGFFRKLRRFSPGRLIGRALPFAASLVPGGGAALDAARGLGLYEGDPGHPPKRIKPSHVPKGGRGHPIHKGHVKRQGGVGRHRSLIFGSHPVLDVGGVLRKAAGALHPGVGAVLEQQHAQDFPDELAPPDLSDAAGNPPPQVPGHALVATPDGGAALVPHGVKHRMPTIVHRRVDAWMRRPGTHMHFGNVKALRRAARRAEGFTRMYHQVTRAFPALRPAHHHAPPRAPKRRKR